MRSTSKAAEKLEPTSLDLILALNVLPESRAREIIVYSESGIIKRWFPPTDFQHKGLITIHSIPVEQAHWLRVEVRGTPPHILTEADGDTNFIETNAVLAATNFVPVVNQPPKLERPGVRS